MACLCIFVPRAIRNDIDLGGGVEKNRPINCNR